MVEDGKVVFSQHCIYMLFGFHTLLLLFSTLLAFPLPANYVSLFTSTSSKLCTLKIEIKGSRNWVSRVDGWRCCKPTTAQIKVLTCLNLNTWLLRQTSHVFWLSRVNILFCTSFRLAISNPGFYSLFSLLPLLFITFITLITVPIY